MRTMIKPVVSVVLAAALGLAAHAAPLAAQKSENFNWSRALPAGRTLEIKGVNGGISAVGTNGGEVRVRAEKRSKKGLASEVKIEVLETSSGVTICAVYPTPKRRSGAGRENKCTAGSNWNVNTDNNDVTVEWTIEVPRGVNLAAQTVNGGIEIARMQSDVIAETVNGGVDVSTTGLVRAKTVNGSLDVAMGRMNWPGTLNFETVNGSISVTFTGALNAQVSAETVNGGISSDWPLTVRGKWGPKSMNGTIGDGGRSLKLSTVNGDIEINNEGGSRTRNR